MSYHEDFFTKEATFIRAAKRDLASGGEMDSIDKLRLLCFSKGATGILRLGRSLRNLGEYGADSVNFEVFLDSIRANRLALKDAEIKDIFDRFAVDGMIHMGGFLERLRPPLTTFRLEMIEKAFGRIEGACDGVITIDDLKYYYLVKVNPRFRGGEIKEAQVLAQFLKSYNGEPAQHGNITKEEFMNYYATISNALDSDDLFHFVMRRGFRI